MKRKANEKGGNEKRGNEKGGNEKGTLQAPGDLLQPPERCLRHTTGWRFATLRSRCTYTHIERPEFCSSVSRMSFLRFKKTQACLRCRPRLPSPIWEEASCSMWTPSAEAFCSYRAREKSFRCRRYEQISRVGYLSGAAGNAFCASSQAQFAHIAHARRAFAALDMSKSRGRAISAALQASRSLIPPKRNLLISRTREGLSLHST